MDASNQLDQVYVRLQDAINEHNHESVVRLCDQILAKKEDEKVAKCRHIALIKSEKHSQLTAEYAKLSAPIASVADETSSLHYAYFLYQGERFDECNKFLNQTPHINSFSFSILQAQVFNKLSLFAESAEAYFRILKKFPKSDIYADLLVNAISSAISSSSKDIQENARMLCADFLRQRKDGETREIVYNYSALLSALKRHEESLDQQKRFKALAAADGEKQDEIMAVVLSDTSDQSNSKVFANPEDIEKKVRQYEEFMKVQSSISDKNLRAVVANNLVVFRALLKQQQDKNDHFSESARLLDDALGNKYKQTPQQILAFKLNKVLLLLHKGKTPESLALLSEIEKTSGDFSQSLELTIRFITIKAFVLLRSKKEDTLSAFLGTLQSNYLQNANAPTQLRIDVFLLLAEIAKNSASPAAASTAIIENFVILATNTKDKSVLYDNNVICGLILAHIAKVREDTTSNAQRIVQSVLDEIAANTTQPQILQYLGDVYSKTNAKLAAQIYIKLTQQFPKESTYHQRLAKIHSASGEFDKAEALLQNIKFQLITEYQELSKLESEIALSKISLPSAAASNAAAAGSQKNGVVKKISKTSTNAAPTANKKRIRYPKGFDPKNPGPPPNPERWLPKWERKDYKKKKGAALNSRTQGSAAAAQDHTSTTKTFSVANSTSHQKATENKKTNKKKNKK